MNMLKGGGGAQMFCLQVHFILKDKRHWDSFLEFLSSKLSDGSNLLKSHRL